MQNFHDFRFHTFDNHRRTYCLRSNRTALLAGISSLLVCTSFFTAILIGKYPISLTALLAGDRMAIRTFWILRLPRALMALFGGFGLGIAGFVYQTILPPPTSSESPQAQVPVLPLRSSLSPQASSGQPSLPLSEDFSLCASLSDSPPLLRKKVLPRSSLPESPYMHLRRRS